MIDALNSALGERYRVGGELGRGGMATVFEAADLRHHRSVAIKVLDPVVGRVLGLERFRREIETTARLTHPHIVPIFDSGVVPLGNEVAPYYVMPLIAGRSLRERLAAEPRLPLEEALAIIRDVGAGLSHAHAQGILHRDVKPENVLLVDGQAVLTDFGIARPLDPQQRDGLTSTGIRLGTPDYMSPEQLVGEGELDARSDQYSLAAMLYEMLAGRPPFRGPSGAAARRLAGDAPSLRASVPRSIDVALHRALAPAPADRFPSVDAFLAELGPGEVGPPPGRGRRRIALAVAGLLVAGAAALTVLFLPRRAPADRRLGVALMPFRASGSAAQWSETLPDLMATSLTGTPGLRIVDPWGLWRPLRPSPGAQARSPDRDEAERLAGRVRAGRFVLGSLVSSGDRLELNLRVYQRGRPEPTAAFALSSRADSAIDLGQRAAVELMGRLGDPRSAGWLPRSATSSPDALKAYLAAREAMRRGLVDSADAAISRALALDSTFALALVEAVGIRSWTQTMRGVPFSGLRELVDRASAVADSLPLRFRLRLEAIRADIATDGPRAAAAWRRIIELDSTDVTAWNGLAYTSHVYGWQFGVSGEGLLEVADRAFSLDSTYVPALLARASLVSLRGDTTEARLDLGRLRRIESPSALVTGTLRGLEALLAPDSAYPALLDTIARSPPLSWASVIRRLRESRPDRALQLAQRLRATAPAGFAFNLATSAEAGLLIAVGRLRAVDSIRGRGTYAGAPFLDQVVDWTLLASAIVGVEDSSLTREIVTRRTAALPRDSALALINERPVWFGGWLLAAYHATLGDQSEARAWIGTMGTFPRSGSPKEWAAAEQMDVASRLAERAGLSDSAAALAERAFDLWTIHTDNTPGYGPEPAIRFHLAETLRGRGLPDSAAVLFRSLVPPTTWISPYTARALYELALIAEQQGEAAAALRYFDRALQFWELGGAEVAGWRDRAQAGVRRNAGESRAVIRRSGRAPAA